MQHIETIELDSSQSSITFSSIPQDYDDLILVSSARTDRANEADGIAASFNSTSANESRVQLFGSGSSASSTSASSIRLAVVNGNSSTSNTFGNASAYISNYTASQAKSISLDTVSENNSTTAFQEIHAALWNDTSAITSITLSADIGSNLLSGSTFSLYGITAGGSGTVTTA